MNAAGLINAGWFAEMTRLNSKNEQVKLRLMYEMAALFPALIPIHQIQTEDIQFNL